MSWFSVHRAAEGLCVHIGDFIGQGADATELVAQIEGATRIELTIDSHGGDAFAALEVYSALKGRVPVATVNGVCGSAAVLIMLAADHVRIVQEGQVMVHRPSVVSMLATAPELRAQADALDSLTAQWIGLLAKRTGDAELVRSWFAGPEDTWLSADAARQFGLVDTIFDPPAADEARSTLVDLPFETAPERPSEDFILDLMRALGPVRTRNKARLARELTAWFATNVTQP